GLRPLTRLLFEHRLRDWHRGERVRPADVEGKMRDGFGNFSLFKAILHAECQVGRELRGLAVRDQRADRHEAAVARRKVGPQPEIAKKRLLAVFLLSRRYHE